MQPVAVIANCIMDLSYEVDTFPRAGETIVAENFDTGFGGKGANQAVAAARTGGDVRVVGAVGEDEFGRDTIQNFQENGISTDQIQVCEGEGTGLATIMVDADGENMIAVAPRANQSIRPADIEDIPADWFNVSMIAGVLGVDSGAIEAAFCRTKDIGSATTVLNAAPAREIPNSLWQVTDCLIVNESEAEFYTGISPDRDQYTDCLNQLRERGPERIILTLGKAGAVVLDSSIEEYVSARAVDAVDTTGAGDAFIGRYLSARSQQIPIVDALNEANHYAGESVQSRGTQKSFPHSKP